MTIGDTPLHSSLTMSSKLSANYVSRSICPSRRKMSTGWCLAKNVEGNGYVDDFSLKF